MCPTSSSKANSISSRSLTSNKEKKKQAPNDPKKGKIFE
jgi:hypothetical protein